MRMPWSNRRAVVAGFVAAIGACTAGLVARAASVDEEYLQRVKKLAPDDLDGHYQLALWCQEQKAWELLRKECGHILRLDPSHKQAKLLLDLANSKLGSKQETKPGKDTPSGPGERPPGDTFVRLLTEEEIQTLRRAELLCGQPERVTVKFENDVVERFVQKMMEQGWGQAERVAFLKRPPAAKAQAILCAEPADVRDLFAKDVLLTSDPQRFRDFERNVLPVVQRGCTVGQCHGGPSAGTFRLFTASNPSRPELYTNYLLIHEFSKGNDRLVNRSLPVYSLLLTYGLKTAPAERAHPIAIDPVYRDERDPKYRAVLQWIQSLGSIRPDYGIELAVQP